MLRLAAAAVLFGVGAAAYIAAARRQQAYAAGSEDPGIMPEGAMVEPVEYVDPQDAPPLGQLLRDVVEGAAYSVADGVQGMDSAQADRNVAAFLAMIRAAEGTARPGGYGALFGWPAAGRSFDADNALDHPRQFFPFTDKAGRRLRTSAAGAYQVTVTTWDDGSSGRRIRTSRGINGFRPAEQDSFAIGLLELDGALSHVRAGRFARAVAIARRRWASLPGAGYNQPERPEQFITDAYINAGGAFA